MEPWEVQCFLRIDKGEISIMTLLQSVMTTIEFEIPSLGQDTVRKKENKEGEKSAEDTLESEINAD